MAILDSKGRLFGRISILDVGALLIIVMILGGIFFFPGTSGSVAQVGTETRPIEVDVMVRGLTVGDPEAFFKEMQQSKTADIIVRNQPYGQVDVKAVKSLPRSVSVPQPDGSVKAFDDPRPELNYTIDMLITLAGEAQITEDGPVLGNKIKVGTPIELEGPSYTFRASTIAVRVED